MSYTPIGWQTGDTITAEKLNKMDPGWGVSSTQETLCNETVTTAYDSEQGMNLGMLTYSTPITADVLLITFDGVEYECHAMSVGGGTSYGGMTEQGPDFSVYPFMLYSGYGANGIYTETAGTYTIKIDAVETTYDVSTAFTTVVNSVAPVFRAYAEATTWQEVHDAVKAGKIVYIIKDTEIDDNELKVQIVTRVFIDENTGRYYVDAITQRSESLASIVSYIASTANSPIEPN